MTFLTRFRPGLLMALFLVSVFVLGVTKTYDTDAWLHLSMGRLIWDLKAMPSIDPYVYTAPNGAFLYSSWLFALVYYLVYAGAGSFGITLIKALSVLAAFFILLRDALRPFRNTIVAVAVLTGILLIARTRFVERPDTVLMVFLSFSIFSLNAFLFDGKKYLYALPLVHLLWANSHSSINLMIIPFVAFIAGSVAAKFASRFFTINAPQLSRDRIRTVVLVLLASFVASLISPYGLGQYTFGAEIIATDWYKQEIVELLPPVWPANKAPFVLSFVTLLSFVLAKRRFSVIHFLLVLPFVVLAFTSLRFIFILAVVAGPILARNLSLALPRLLDEKEPTGSEASAVGRSGSLVRDTLAAAVAAGVIASTGLALAHVRPFDDGVKRFGYGFDESAMPKGAVDYLASNGVTGRVFNSFQWGQYVIWNGYPARTVFVDGRGYLPVDLLEKMNLARHRPYLLDELYAAFGFESILVTYPMDEGGISGLNYDEDRALTHPGWALVYWDDNGLLYLRRSGPYQKLIDRDEYRFVRPANLVTGAGAQLRDEKYRVAFVRELLRNVETTGSSSAYASLGYVYNESGLYRQAIDAYLHVRPHVERDYLPAALAGIAQAYGKLDDVDNAIRYYQKALDLSPDAGLTYKLGLAYLSQDEKKKAIRYFERALSLSGDLLSVYPLLIRTYHELGMDTKAAEAAERYERAKVVGRGEEHFKAGLAAYMAHNYEKAAEEFSKSIEANPWNPVAYSNLGYLYFDMGLPDRAYPYQRKSLEIDPNYANAHYGLALIYKQQGDRAMARHHWEEYLRLEPSGYYSRKAKEEIRSLQ